jgi:hypothetical protein
MTGGTNKLKRTEFQGDQSSVDKNRVIVTGENNFFRLSLEDESAVTSEASFWRVLFSPAGPGHALFLRSELTDDRWRIYADNIGMARWLQRTVQGMLSAPTRDESIQVVEATFNQRGDARYFRCEDVVSDGGKVVLTWADFGDPVLVHSMPNAQPDRPYGVCTVLVPALEIRLTVNAVQAKGKAWPRDRMGRPFSTGGLGLAESWTEAR